MTRKDLPCLLFLAALLLVQFSPILFTGRCYFLGDLTYFYHPWHVLPAELLTKGQLPFWNPYSYMGMPLHGAMQSAVFSPASLPFYFFPFPSAYKAQLFLHHALAAFLAFLWMRRLGRWPATLAATLFSLGGFLTGHVEIINWTATLAWWPAFFLFAGRPLLLGLTLAVSLAAGYPPIWAGMAAGALALSWLAGLARLRSALAALLIGLSLSAIILIPGLEMARQSTRRDGVPIEDRMIHSLSASDLFEFLGPRRAPGSESSGAKFPLSKCFYLGYLGGALALLGLHSLCRRKTFFRATLVLAYLTAVMVLLLGRHNPLSTWLWTNLPPLNFLRAPAFMSFLPLAALIPLAALGLRAKSWAPLVCLAAALELLYYGRNIQPTMPDGYFSERGPLAARLQTTLLGHRYAASPTAARSLEGQGSDPEARYADLKSRLYGVSNTPYHLHAATGMGESMLLAGPFSVMDFIFRLSSASEAAPFLRWLDVGVLLTKSSPLILEKPLRAWWTPEAETANLEHDFKESLHLRSTAPENYQEPREDRFLVFGAAPGPGWVVVSNAFYKGWKAHHTQDGRSLDIHPAWGAFSRIAVAGGRFSVAFHFDPDSYRWAALLTLASLAGVLGAALHEL